MNTVFQFNAVSKRYKDLVALDEFSLTGERGKVIALLGENGAGKTTAIKILLGLLEANSGDASVLGMKSRTEGDRIRKLVGYVPDNPTLYEWMTVAEIGWFVSGFMPQFNYLNQYEELIRRFQLSERKKIKELSRGMKAKVALSLAMAHNPSLLVLDEPTSGLDPMVRREFLESMVDVAAEGRTVLLSSHQILEVERVADSVAIIKQGKLELFESLESLKQRVSELTITLKNGRPDLPHIPGWVISQKKQGLTWQVIVRDFDFNMLEQVRNIADVSHAEMGVPSLEDIFLGYMHGDAGLPTGPPSVSQSEQPVADTIEGDTQL